jgi:hypothetical protein
VRPPNQFVVAIVLASSALPVVTKAVVRVGVGGRLLNGDWGQLVLPIAVAA